MLRNTITLRDKQKLKKKEKNLNFLNFASKREIVKMKRAVAGVSFELQLATCSKIWDDASSFDLLVEWKVH